MALASVLFCLSGATCVSEDEGKATNDSATTVDVTATTAVATTAVPTTVKPTEQPTTKKVVVETTAPVKEADEGKDVDEEMVDEPDDKDESKEERSISGYSEHEIDLIAKTTYLESGNCGEYCQWLTASTILNLADRSGGVANVVYDYNTFNVAGYIDGCSPSDLSYSVARRVASGDRDYNVMAFRAGYYHSFGTPYESADNVYFSTY